MFTCTSTINTVVDAPVIPIRIVLAASLNNLDSELVGPEVEVEVERETAASGECEVPSLSGSSPSRSHSHTTGGTGGPGDPLSDMVSGVSGSGHVSRSPSPSPSPSESESATGLTGSARASPSSSVHNHNEVLVLSTHLVHLSVLYTYITMNVLAPTVQHSTACGFIYQYQIATAFATTPSISDQIRQDDAFRT